MPQAPNQPAGTCPHLGRVVIVGGGAVGALFAGTLVSSAASLHVIDAQPAVTGTIACSYIQSDAGNPTAPAAAALAAAECVIVALPEAAAEAAMPTILATMPNDALLVDTLSVKTGIFAVYESAQVTQQILSVNPMFAPSLGFAGHGAIVVTVSTGPRADRFLELLRSSGCRLLTMTADDHDRATAGLQAMTHAAILGFGLGLAELGHDVSRLAPVMPPPHRAMLGWLARMTGAAPETYRDIQAANPHAAAARAALTDAIANLSSAATDPAAFADLMAGVSAFLGDAAEPLAAEVAAMLTPPATPAD